MIACSKLAAESAVANDEEDPDDVDEDPKKVQSDFIERYPPPVRRSFKSFIECETYSHTTAP